MNILALDPANKTGWCVVTENATRFGTWQISDTRDQHRGSRLARLREFIFRVRRRESIDLLVYEDAVMGSHFFKTQQVHGEIRGVILLVAHELGIEARPVNPMTLKSWLTGSGKAKKPDMIAAVKRRFDIQTDDDNQADAVALALYMVHQLRVEEANRQQIKLPF